MAFEINISGEIIPFPTWEGSGLINSSDLENQLKAAGGQDLKVNINSNGGDIDEGFLMYAMLRKYADDNKAKVITYAKGRCQSIATVIFLAGDERIANKFLAPFFHNAWAYAEGDTKEITRVAVELEKLNDRIASHYASHTDLTFKEAKALMEAETYLSPEEAVKIRFATKVEKISRPVALSNALNKVNKNNQNNNKIIMSNNNKVLKDIAKFFNSLGAKNAVEISTAESETLVFPDLEEGASPAIGDAATIDGSNAEGDYTLPDGTVYTFAEGKLTAIEEPEEEETDQNSEFENLKKENADLKQKLEAQNKVVEAQNKEIKGIQTKVSEIEGRWNKLSGIMSKYSSEEEEEQEDKTKTPGFKNKSENKGGLSGAAKRFRSNKK